MMMAKVREKSSVTTVEADPVQQNIEIFFFSLEALLLRFEVEAEEELPPQPCLTPLPRSSSTTVSTASKHFSALLADAWK